MTDDASNICKLSTIHYLLQLKSTEYKADFELDLVFILSSVIA